MDLSHSRCSGSAGWKFKWVMLIFLAACGKERVPDEVIAQKAMVPLLIDFHLAEGYLTTLPLDSLRMVSNSYYEAVFDRHHTDSATFHQSLRYYSARPQLLNAMYKEVQTALEAGQRIEQDKVDARMQLVYQADSVRNAYRQDSIMRSVRDSTDLKRMQTMLFWKHPDSSSLKPAPWSLTSHRKWMGPMLWIKEEEAPPDSTQQKAAEPLKAESR